MRHRKKVQKLGLKKSHRTALMRNLIASLVAHERLRTTKNRAKSLASNFDRVMRTVQKKEQREAIRAIASVCGTPTASRKLVGELKKRYEGRTSGFTRITQIATRKGDNATLVQIELI